MLELIVPVTDEELVPGWIAREEGAVAELIDRYWEPAYRVAVRLIGDPGQAEDAAQETFLQVLKTIDGFDPARSFRPWFFTILRRVASNQRRGEQRRRAREERVATPEATTTSPDHAEAVHTYLGRLDPDLRDVLTLHYLGGLTHREVADALGCPAGTVSDRIKRGLARLRASLKPVAALSPAALVVLLGQSPPLPVPTPLSAAELSAELARAPLDLPSPPEPSELTRAADAARGKTLSTGGKLAALAGLLVSAGAAATLLIPDGASPPGLAQGDRPARAPEAVKTRGSETPGAKPTDGAAAKTKGASSTQEPKRAGSGKGSNSPAEPAPPPPAEPIAVPQRFKFVRGSGHKLRSHAGTIELELRSAAGRRTATLTTDARGFATLPLVPGRYKVRAQSGLRASRWQTAQVTGKTWVSVWLSEPGSRVRVRVLDDGGRPVLGARARAWRATRRDLNAAFSDWSLSDGVYLRAPEPIDEVTGTDGVIELVGVEPGTYLILARRGQLAGRSALLTVGKPGGATAATTVTLSEALKTGHLEVVLAESTPGVSTVWVDVRPPNSGGISRSIGRGELSKFYDLPVGRARIRVSIRGAGTHVEHAMITVGATTRVVVRPGAKPAASLTGRVLLPNGQPATAGVISLPAPFFSQAVIKGGAFTLRDLPPQVRSIRVSVPGWPTATFPLPLGAAPLRLPSRPALLLQAQPAVPFDIQAEGHRSYSDERGRFRLFGEVGQRIQLRVVPREGYAPRDLTVTVVPGNVVSIPLTPLRLGQAESATVTGRALDHQGQPLAGATIRVGRDTVTTNATGAFRFTNLHPGEVTLRGDHPTAAPLRRPLKLVRGGTIDLKLTFARGVRVAGTVANAPAHTSWITATREGAQAPLISLTLGRADRFDLGRLPAGTWRLEVRSRAGRIATGTVLLAGEDQTGVRLTPTE